MSLTQTDPRIAELIRKEADRQANTLELIASENHVSAAVMEAAGSVLTNKYAEGYPGARYYGGCGFYDEIETLAIERAKQLFGCKFANVQPHSGANANFAAFMSLMKPGDTYISLNLASGGHLTHGMKLNASAIFYHPEHYELDAKTEQIDFDSVRAKARELKPKMILCGYSAYPRTIDFARFRQIADEVGAVVMADIAHIAGLVAAGVHPSPFPHAHLVTTTTHKTLRGPRGGLILCNDEELAKAINRNVFPGTQGGPLMHIVAAKAVAFGEDLQPAFKVYAKQIVANAAELAAQLTKRGYRLVSGGTDNHLMLVDVGARGMTGKECQIALDAAGITVNKNTIPFETRSPFQASGIRLGTPAVTTRGMSETDMAAIADMISEVLLDIKNLDTPMRVRQRVRELTARFPLPY